MKLMGLDVGYSLTRSTTGIACLDGDQLSLVRTGTAWRVWRRLSSETDHELRAALICLLTAAVASQGTAAVVGEPSGGWFWLPPWLCGSSGQQRGLITLPEPSH